MSFVDYRDHVEAREDRPFKGTLFDGDRLMLGINCLMPGQSQPVHTHEQQDKFYFVLEGVGEFTVGAERRSCGPGYAVCAAAGVDHGVENAGTDPLVFLMTMAPPPSG